MPTREDPAALESFAADLIAGLDAGSRQQLAVRIATLLRQQNQKRIAAQQAPDGTPYAPRKIQSKQGRIRRRMFDKLRTNRFLKAKGTAEGALVGFTAAVSRLASVHHLGLRDRVSRRTSLEVTYTARPLIGITADDEALIADLCAEHLADKL